MPTHTGPKTEWHRFFGYSSGDFGLNLFWQGAGFYLFFYLTNVAGLESERVGLLLLIISVWEAIVDPLIGLIAERTRTRMGAYRPYLLAGSIPLGLSFAALFSLPDLFDTKGADLFWPAAFMLLIFRTTYGLVSIPYAALGARVTTDFDGRTRLAGLRMYCGFLGGLAISYVGKELQQLLSDSAAFSLIGIFAGGLGIFVIIVSALMSKEQSHTNAPTASKPQQNSLKDGLKALSVNKPFRALLAGLALITIATTMIGQTMLYMFETVVLDRNPGNLGLLIMAGAPIITIPIWSTITLRAGKRDAWFLASAIAAIGALMTYILPSQNAFLMLFSVGVIVLGLSGFGVIYWAALPDTIEHGESKTGARPEALLIGVASAVQKLAIGFAAYLLGLLLDFAGHTPNQAASETTKQAIHMIFSGVPLVCLLLSIGVMAFYTIDRASHRKALKTISEQANKAS